MARNLIELRMHFCTGDPQRDFALADDTTAPVVTFDEP
jgi:hypothetical protein